MPRKKTSKVVVKQVKPVELTTEQKLYGEYIQGATINRLAVKHELDQQKVLEIIETIERGSK